MSHSWGGRAVHHCFFGGTQENPSPPPPSYRLFPPHITLTLDVLCMFCLIICQLSIPKPVLDLGACIELAQTPTPSQRSQLIARRALERAQQRRAQRIRAGTAEDWTTQGKRKSSKATAAPVFPVPTSNRFTALDTDEWFDDPTTFPPLPSPQRPTPRAAQEVSPYAAFLSRAKSVNKKKKKAKTPADKNKAKKKKAKTSGPGPAGPAPASAAAAAPSAAAFPIETGVVLCKKPLPGRHVMHGVQDFRVLPDGECHGRDVPMIPL